MYYKTLNRHKNWEKCYNIFKQYLLNDSNANRHKLRIAFNRLPEENQLVCEIIEHNDPVIRLMRSNEDFKFTKDNRKIMLLEYYENEWFEKDFVA